MFFFLTFFYRFNNWQLNICVYIIICNSAISREQNVWIYFFFLTPKVSSIKSLF